VSQTRLHIIKRKYIHGIEKKNETSTTSEYKNLKIVLRYTTLSTTKNICQD